MLFFAKVKNFQKIGAAPCRFEKSVSLMFTISQTPPGAELIPLCSFCLAAYLHKQSSYLMKTNCNKHTAPWLAAASEFRIFFVWTLIDYSAMSLEKGSVRIKPLAYCLFASCVSSKDMLNTVVKGEPEWCHLGQCNFLRSHGVLLLLLSSSELSWTVKVFWSAL